MSKDQYPLFRRCFPDVTIEGLPLGWCYTSHIELALEGAVAVECYKLGDSGLLDEHGAGWTAAEPDVLRGKHPKDTTHTAILLGLEPLKKKTLDEVVKQIIERSDFNDYSLDDVFKSLLNEARELLREK